MNASHPHMNASQPQVVANAPVLAHLRDHIPVALLGEDPRGVHQVRVATRRLGVWLALGGHRVLLDDLRWLRASAASVRDLDVLCATELPPTWFAWLDTRRVHARAVLTEALGSSRLRGLLIALELMPPIPLERARRGAKDIARATRKIGRVVGRGGATLDEVHAMRRALRRLRYAREWLGAPVEQLIEAQDSLGALNDASVALRLLDAFGGEGMEEVREVLEGRIDAGRGLALDVWTSLRDGFGRDGFGVDA